MLQLYFHAASYQYYQCLMVLNFHSSMLRIVFISDHWKQEIIIKTQFHNKYKNDCICIENYNTAI